MVIALAPLAVADSEAILWDLLIDANVVGDIVHGGDIIITGRVSNHAGWAEPSDVQIIVGGHSIERNTGPDGVFTIGIKDIDMLPGTHAVYVRATTQEGLTGVLNMRIMVEGEFKPSEHTAKMLSTRQAQYYLGSNSTDFENDPIGAKLFKYYHNIQEQFDAQRKAELSIAEIKTELDTIREESAKAAKESAMELEDAKTADILSQKIFLEGLDDYERDIFIAQMNYTRNIHDSLVAANPGAEQDSEKSILERNREYSIPRHVMESLTPKFDFDIDEFLRSIGATGVAPSEAEPESEPEPVAEPAVEPTRPGITTVYLDVDGVMTKHVYNGTSLVRAE